MAAGLGFKTFTTGEVLTAADVNGYLMQGILVFATEAARNSAIVSPQEGQFAFTKDNNSLWYYTGSAWVASGATGDIEGVTAGTGISGGGTSGTVTITNDMATTITASGDIVVGTGNGTYDNLPIGSTGQVLTADTTVSPYKVKWAAPASTSYSYTLLNSPSGTSMTGAASITINVTSKDYYYINFADVSAGASSAFTMRLNNDSTASIYQYRGLSLAGTSASSVQSGGTSFLVGTMGSSAGGDIKAAIFVSGGNGAGFKPIQVFSGGDAGTTNLFYSIGGHYGGTSAVTSFTFISSVGNFDTGTVYIYGA